MGPRRCPSDAGRHDEVGQTLTWGPSRAADRFAPRARAMGPVAGVETVAARLDPISRSSASRCECAR